MRVDEYETVQEYFEAAQKMVLHQHTFSFDKEEKAQLIVALVAAMAQVNLANAIQSAAKEK